MLTVDILQTYYTNEHLDFYLSKKLISQSEYTFIRSLHDTSTLDTKARQIAVNRFSRIEDRLSSALTYEFNKDTRDISKHRSIIIFASQNEVIS